MENLAQLLVFIGLIVQMSTCNPSCVLHGLVVNCEAKNLRWVPALPPNITHLYLYSNYIGEINSSSLRAYEHLEDVDLGWQNVPLIIRNNAFYYQKKLKRLNLSQYRTGLHLELRAFEGLVNLQQLLLDSSGLTDSILSESYMEPLLSLEMLDLTYNNIRRLRPGSFFSKLKHFTTLKLKLNSIERLCEDDLVAFKGKIFSLMDLHSNKLAMMFKQGFDSESCGNPFRGMAFITLNISSNGFMAKSTELFFKTIEGTPITCLVFSNHLGKGFSHNNFPDPDEKTFEGLMNSSLKELDLSGNQIFALQSGIFRSLKEAMVLDISKNKVNQIPRRAFDGLQEHLTILNLSSNLLGEIRHYTFSDLTALRLLDLSKNNIGILGYQAFSGLSNLQWLIVTENSLRRLDSTVSLPNLQYLFLGDNKLETLHGISTLGPNLTHVDVENNRLTNINEFYEIVTKFRHLQVLFYGGNILLWCEQSPVAYISSMQKLDLQASFLNSLWVQGKCLSLFDNFKNLLYLTISFNLLTFLPQGVFRGLLSVRQMDLSHNALTYLEPHSFPKNLEILDLSYNMLASPDPTSFSSLVYLNLAENRFHCDCNLERFLDWSTYTNVTFLSPLEELTCEFPANLYKFPLQEYQKTFEPCEDEEKAAQELMLVLFIASALLVITFILSGIVYARFRGHVYVVYKRIVGRVLESPKPTPAVEEWQYDAFFCFTNNDYRWVEAALLEKLDNQFSEKNLLRCCFEARDFLPGEDHLSNIRDAIWSSRKTVCIVSKEFLKEGWCLEAFALAQGRMLEELRNILVVIVVGKVPHYQLMKHDVVRAFVQKRHYLVWPEDPQDLQWFYEQLVSQIIKDTNLNKSKEDKPELVKPEKGDVQLHIEDCVELEPMGMPAM